MSETVFPKGHPYSWPVIGSQEDLTNASLEDVKEFFRTYYTPNNLSLVIAGDFEPAEAKRLVEKYFGDIPPGPALDRPAKWIPRSTARSWSRSTTACRSSASTSAGQRRVLQRRRRDARHHSAHPERRPVVAAEPRAGLRRQIATNVTRVQHLRPRSQDSSSSRRRRARAARSPRSRRSSRRRSPSSRRTVRRRRRSSAPRTSRSRSSSPVSNASAASAARPTCSTSTTPSSGDPGKLEADLARTRAVTPDAVRAAVGEWLNTRNRARDPVPSREVGAPVRCR